VRTGGTLAQHHRIAVGDPAGSVEKRPQPGAGDLILHLELAVAGVAQQRIAVDDEGRRFQIGPVAFDANEICVPESRGGRVRSTVP